MNILAFRGSSLISRLIRWQTRSPYSHVAIELDNGVIFEAWHRGGVIKHDARRSLLDVHEHGTQVDVLRVDMLEGFVPATEQWLDRRVGSRYDFRSVLRFVTRRPAVENNRWFCSELVSEALSHVGMFLQHAPSHDLSPRDIVMSPKLELVDTITLCPTLLRCS